MTTTNRITTRGPQRRVRRFVSVAVAVSLVGLGGLAGADDTVPDGDGALPVSAALNPLNFGTVCVGQTYVDNVLVAIKRAQTASPDPARVFANSATVTVSSQATPDDSADLTEAFSDSTIGLPSNWGSVALGTMSTDAALALANPSATVDVTLVPSAAGVFSKNVNIRAQGLNIAATPVVITRSVSFKVNWTAANCDNDPPAVTHTVGTPSYVNGTDTYVTSATSLSFSVNETAHGNSGLSSCTVSVTGAATGNFTCVEGANNYTLSTSAPLSLASAPDGTYSSSASATDTFTNNTSDSFDVILDNTAPTFGACSGGPYLLGSNGGSESVSVTAGDGTGSGVDSGTSTLSGTVDTTTVGLKTVGYSATDNVGNNATTSCDYSVVYSWSGFFQPVDNLPTMNAVKAGQGIPIKFSLGGNQGLNIFAAGWPKVFVVNCTTSADLDSIESTMTAGGSSLSYDALAGQYVYVWKTDKAWANSCRQLDVKLIDGTTHSALFKFTK